MADPSEPSTPGRDNPAPSPSTPFAPPTLVAGPNMLADLDSILSQIPDSPPRGFNLATVIASLQTVQDTTDLTTEQLKEKCIFCHDPKLTQPCKTECGHVFCAECVLTWVATNKSCPSCRATVSLAGCVLLEE